MDDNQNRRAERIILRADIDVRRPGDHRYKVNILDFSPAGCRIEIPIYVDEGDSIFITLPGLETIEGKVRWKKDWIVGVEFLRPLYPAVFDLMREKMARQ